MGRRNLTLNDAHSLVVADHGPEMSRMVETAAAMPAMVAYARDRGTNAAHGSDRGDVTALP
jgi:hypothetical protein